MKYLLSLVLLVAELTSARACGPTLSVNSSLKGYNTVKVMVPAEQVGRYPPWIHLFVFIDGKQVRMTKDVLEVRDCTLAGGNDGKSLAVYKIKTHPIVSYRPMEWYYISLPLPKQVVAPITLRTCVRYAEDTPCTEYLGMYSGEDKSVVLVPKEVIKN